MKVRFVVTKTYEIVEVLIHVAMLRKSPTGNELAALVLHNISNVGLELKNWRAGMLDRAVGKFYWHNY